MHLILASFSLRLCAYHHNSVTLNVDLAWIDHLQKYNLQKLITSQSFLLTFTFLLIYLRMGSDVTLSRDIATDTRANLQLGKR